jgi:hypothetical protein
MKHSSVRIGVIADTHGLFDILINRHFAGVDHIIHAGDIGNRSVIDALRKIAPVIAVSGNVDDYGASEFPSEVVVELGGFRIAVRHILYQRGTLTSEGTTFLERVKPDVCLFGHTHRPVIERFGRTLLINPGSAGPKRFTLPRGVGVLTLTNAGLVPLLLRLRGSALSRSSRPKNSAQKSPRIAL